MPSLDFLPNVSQSDWNELFALLSLDSVTELYPYLALELKDSLTFHHRLQDCIRDARRQQDDVVSKKATASEIIFACLRAQTGDDFQLFSQWCREALIGTHADQPQISVWNLVFSPWSNGRDWPSGIPSDKMGALAREYKSQCARSGRDAKIEAIKLKPISDWDVEMYTRHNWNHFDDVHDPFITLSIMASVNCTRKFLESLVRHWTPEELQALTRGAQAAVESLGIWMPGPVPTPEEALRS